MRVVGYVVVVIQHVIEHVVIPMEVIILPKEVPSITRKLEVICVIQSNC